MASEPGTNGNDRPSLVTGLTNRSQISRCARSEPGHSSAHLARSALNPPVIKDLSGRNHPVAAYPLRIEIAHHDLVQVLRPAVAIQGSSLWKQGRLNGLDWSSKEYETHIRQA